MFSVFYLSKGCNYKDRYGNDYTKSPVCYTVNFWGFKLPITLPKSSNLYDIMYFTLTESNDAHLYSYYVMGGTFRKLNMGTGGHIIFLVSSVGWELFEAYIWRTSPISVFDLVSNTLGYTIGYNFGNNVEVVFGVHPMKKYPDVWVKRKQADDSQLLSMVMSRFNTNYEPKVLYFKFKTPWGYMYAGYSGGIAIWNKYLKAQDRDMYMYYTKYEGRGVEFLFFEGYKGISLKPFPYAPMKPSKGCFFKSLINCMMILEVFGGINVPIDI